MKPPCPLGEGKGEGLSCGAYSDSAMPFFRYRLRKMAKFDHMSFDKLQTLALGFRA
jgi:hypothetical protein